MRNYSRERHRCFAMEAHLYSFGFPGMARGLIRRKANAGHGTTTWHSHGPLEYKEFLKGSTAVDFFHVSQISSCPE